MACSLIEQIACSILVSNQEMAVEFSVIIPARGNARDLTICIESIMAQKTQVEYETIVAYCDQDMEVTEVVSRFPLLKKATSGKYLLPGEARNLGATRAMANLLAFIDSDCILQDDWITNAIRTFQEGAVLCSGAIRDTYPWDLIASSDNRLQYADFPLGRLYGTARYFPGVHLAVRRSTFDAVGGFCDSPHGQDVIFTIKIAANWPSETIFNPKMIASHAGRHMMCELISHHQNFGHARALEKIQFNASMEWIAQHPWLGWMLWGRRFVYISFRVVQWNVTDLIRYVFQLPFILIGLTAWVKGFYHGMADRTKGYGV